MTDTCNVLKTNYTIGITSLGVLALSNYEEYLKMLEFLTLNTTLTLLGVCLFIKLSNQLNQMVVNRKANSTEDYLFKIARITGSSEYDIFIKAAETWPVSRATVESDFKNYLLSQTIPYYVNDFIRKNKHHIDEIHLSQF